MYFIIIVHLNITSKAQCHDKMLPSIAMYEGSNIHKLILAINDNGSDYIHDYNAVIAC